MKKTLLTSSLLLSVVLALPVSAAPRERLDLPTRAVRVAPDTYRLGTAYDKDSFSLVEGYAIVHKRRADARDGSARVRGGSTACYALMASGAKWKNIENWEVFEGAGLSGDFLLNNLSLDIGKWEAAAGADILGDGSLTSGTPADPYVLDDLNQVLFGDLSADTLAVTVVWGIFGGKTSNRRLVAWHQIYNTDYPWSASGEADKMDFENIATHELGHSMGMADIYSSSCADVTMYGYGAYGETNKQTLEPADITGINLLY